MKRLVIRLSIFSFVAVVGVIGIAQARHGLPSTGSESAPADAVAPSDIPAGEPRPIEVDQNARPISTSDEANPLRSSEMDVPGLPGEMGHLPHTQAIPQNTTDDRIPAAGVALARREVEVSRRQIGGQDGQQVAAESEARLQGEEQPEAGQHARAEEPAVPEADSERTALAAGPSAHLDHRHEQPVRRDYREDYDRSEYHDQQTREAPGSSADEARRESSQSNRPQPTLAAEDPSGSSSIEATYGRRSANREDLEGQRQRPGLRNASRYEREQPRAASESTLRADTRFARGGASFARGGASFARDSSSEGDGYGESEIEDANPLRAGMGGRFGGSDRMETQQVRPLDAGAESGRDAGFGQGERPGLLPLGEADRSPSDFDRGMPRGSERTDEGEGRPGGEKLEGMQAPSLTLQKFAPPEIQVGKECKFEIVVRNVGQIEARAVQVQDVIPKGTTLVGTEPRADVSDGGRLVWDLGTLAAGSEAKVAAVLMPVAEGEIGSIATVHFAAQASVRTVATKPELSVQLSAPPQVMAGEQTTINIELSNPGSGAATGVILLENVPEGLSHPAGRALEFEVGTLAAGESRELALTLNAERAGIYRNVLVATADANIEVQGDVEIEVVAPDLAVAVDGPKRRFLERPATYEVAIQNPGTASAKNVELVTYLPRGMKFVKANNAGTYDPRTHSIIWGLEELPAKQAGRVQLVAIPNEIGEHDIKIEARADRGLADRTEQKISVEGVAAILFELADVNDPIELGGETVYEVRVVNQGSKASTNVQVVALLPPGMRAIAAEGPVRHSVEDGRVVFAPLARLAPKADTMYRFKVQAGARGDQRVRVQVLTDEMSTPVTKEESTRVYADE